MELFSNTLGLFGLGLVLGLKHAFDADHVVAVATLVSQTKSVRKSSIFGILWGAGHTTTLFLAGLVVLLLKVSIPDRFALSFEFIVGILLVILGVDVLRHVLKGEVHIHEHTHGDSTMHTHLHSHSQSPVHSHTHRSYAIGLVHGLAGSGALVLLVLGAVDSVAQGLLFIAIFGVGSIIGMLLTSTLLALPLKFATNFARFDRALRLGAGLISIALGLMIMYEIGVVGGLLL